MLRGFGQAGHFFGLRYKLSMTKDCWQFAKAKSRLSEVLEKAHQRPQRIRRNGKEEFVVLTSEDYEALIPGGAAGLFEPLPPRTAAKDFWKKKS